MAAGLVPLAQNQGKPLGVAIDATHVYFADYQLLGGRIAKVPKAGGAVVPLVADVDYYPTYLVVDATHVYFTRSASQGTPMKVDKNGQGLVEVAPSHYESWGIFLQGSTLYFTRN